MVGVVENTWLNFSKLKKNTKKVTAFHQDPYRMDFNETVFWCAVRIQSEHHFLWPILVGLVPLFHKSRSTLGNSSQRAVPEVWIGYINLTDKCFAAVSKRRSSQTYNYSHNLWQLHRQDERAPMPLFFQRCPFSHSVHQELPGDYVTTGRTWKGCTHGLRPFQIFQVALLKRASVYRQMMAQHSKISKKIFSSFFTMAFTPIHNMQPPTCCHDLLSTVCFRENVIRHQHLTVQYSFL